MKNNETQKFGFSLRSLETSELDDLMASVMREMRRRDSDHVKGDVINGTHKLGKLRRTSKLPTSKLPPGKLPSSGNGTHTS